MTFPLWFFQVLIYGSLTLCVIGALTLLILLFIDVQKGRMW